MGATTASRRGTPDFVALTSQEGVGLGGRREAASPCKTPHCAPPASPTAPSLASEGRSHKTGHIPSAACGFTAAMLMVSLWGRRAALPIFSRLLHPLPGMDASGSRMLVAGLASRPNKYTVAAEHWRAAPAHRAGRREARCLLSDGDGQPGSSEERFVKGWPRWLLLAQLLLQPLEKLFGRFLPAQLAQAAEQAVVQGGLQQRKRKERI